MSEVAVEMITVVIDGFEVTVPKGTLVIRAAEQLGIQIPRFCDHPLLDPVGACRQCLVDIEINGRSFCALGDGATSPITSSIKYFRDEYIAHVTNGACPFDPVASTLFAGAGA